MHFQDFRDKNINNFFEALSVYSEGQNHKFVIHPQRKWNCKKITEPGECFVIAHIIINGIVLKSIIQAVLKIERNSQIINHFFFTVQKQGATVLPQRALVFKNRQYHHNSEKERMRRLLYNHVHPSR